MLLQRVTCVILILSLVQHCYPHRYVEDDLQTLQKIVENMSTKISELVKHIETLTEDNLHLKADMAHLALKQSADVNKLNSQVDALAMTPGTCIAALLLAFNN